MDKKYAEYLNGKTVAVVGPAPSDEDLVEEIDSSDVVIRLNYRGVNLLPNTEEFGSRTDVSYYNGENAVNISGYSDRDFFKDIAFAVFRSIKHEFQENLVNNQSGRINFTPNQMLFCGAANMVQHTLYDLLFFEPNKIKVYKTNFFMAKKAYHDGYSIHQDRGGIKWVWQAYANHNLITQLNLTRWLLKNGLIEVDKTCESVLQLTNKDYMSFMEEIYVDTPAKLLAGDEESK